MSEEQVAYDEGDHYPPPTAAYIGELIEAARDEFKDRDIRDAVRDAAYWQENAIPHPASVDVEPVHMGVATELVERLKGILDDEPTVEVTTTTTIEQRAIARATKVEDFLNTLFSALQDDSDTDTFDNIKEDAIRFGRAYDTLLYVPKRRSTAASDYPRRDGQSEKEYAAELSAWKMNARIPIAWRHLPARGTFVWRDEEGICEALSVERRQIATLLRRFPLPALALEIAAGRVSRLDNAYLGTYWNPHYGAYWVTTAAVGRAPEAYVGVEALRHSVGEVPEVFPNLYGCVPVIETSGLTSSDPRSGRRQKSIMDHLLPLALYLDQLMTQKGSVVRVWAWPTPYLKNLGVRGELIGATGLAADARRAPLEIEPNKLITLLPGEDIGWLIAPENGAGADGLIATIQRQADLLGITSAVFSGEALGSNGYLYNSILNAVRSKYSPIVKHIRRAHRQRCQLALKIIEMHGEPLYLMKPGDGKDIAGEWLALSSKDLKGTKYAITIHFEDRLPIDQASDLAMAVQSTAGDHPLLDHNTARERYLRDTAPERTEERILIQKFRRDQTVEKFLIARAVKKAGLMLDEQELGTPESAAAGIDQSQLPPALLTALGIGGGGQGPPQGLPPAGGTPGGGINVQGPQMAGAATPTGLAAPTTMGGVPGAPQAPMLPGISTPLTPTAPSRTEPAPRRRGGRPPGQSRRPPTGRKGYEA